MDTIVITDWGSGKRQAYKAGEYSCWQEEFHIELWIFLSVVENIEQYVSGDPTLQVCREFRTRKVSDRKTEWPCLLVAVSYTQGQLS